MTTLTGITPSPKQLADAVRERFSDTLRDAAGRDGRISVPEARRIASRDDDGWILSDNAINYLERTGQKSVSAEKLIRRLHEFTEGAASAAAGSNQKLSLVEIRSLPQDLQAEAFYLRGKGLPARVEPATLRDQVQALVVAALDDGTMTRLEGPPRSVRGQRPFIENIPHPSTSTRAIVYLADDRIYVSRAAPAGPGVPLVGWYDAGQAPAR